MGSLGTPIIIKDGQIQANLDLSYDISLLSEYRIPFRYGKGKNKEQPKSDTASKIIDLRLQFQPFCRFYHNHDDFDPEINHIMGKLEGGNSGKDFIYEWNFAHRHGFPSDIDGPGRGQRVKVSDILKHPLSYMLMCNSAHEDYDRENGDWKNSRKHISEDI